MNYERLNDLRLLGLTIAYYRRAKGMTAAIAWSRVYLGVHWPLDMVGGLLAGMCGCLGAALIWHTFGPALYHQLQRLYRLCFSLPIRKGWVRG
mgnify:CR=1 FL=1